MPEGAPPDEVRSMEATIEERVNRVLPVLAGEARALDEQYSAPRAGLGALRESGLMGLLVPHSHGGLGGDTLALVETARRLSGACLSTAMIWAMHCQQVGILVEHAPAALADRTLQDIALGRMFVASVTTEKGKGGHLLSAQAPIVALDDVIDLERDAPVVTGGDFADAYLMTMRAGADRNPTDVVLVFARREQLDVLSQSGWRSMGMRGTQSVALRLSGRLPRSQVLDPVGGFKQLATTTMIPLGHIAWAACWLGAARAAYDDCIGVLRDPRARSGFDLQSELLAARLSRVRLQLDLADAFLDRVVDDFETLRRAGAVDELAAPRFNIAINGLKICASEAAFAVVDDLMQIMGLRYGYLENDRVALERTFRDLRSGRLMYANERLLVANGKLSLLDRNARSGADREQSRV